MTPRVSARSIAVRSLRCLGSKRLRKRYGSRSKFRLPFSPHPLRRSRRENPDLRNGAPRSSGQRSWAAAERASAWSDGIASDSAVASSVVNPGQPALGKAEPAPSRTTSSAEPKTARPKPVSPFSQQPVEEAGQDATPRRRRQDAPEYKQEHPSDSGPGRRKEDLHLSRSPQSPPLARRSPLDPPTGVTPSAALPEPSGPAWLYATVPQAAPPQVWRVPPLP